MTVALALPYRAGSTPTLRTAPTDRWRAAVGAVAHGLVSHPARWLVLAIGVVTAMSSAATLASPYLAGRAPLLLMCLSPRMAFLGIAAQDTPVLTFVLLGTARLALTDPLHYVIGRRLGPRLPSAMSAADPLRRLRHTLRSIAGRVPRPVRLAARPACCLAVLCRPNGVNLLWAGSQRIPAPLVAVLDLVGTTTYLLAMHTGAKALGG